MNTLDYHDTPALLNNYSGNVTDLITTVENKLLAKAQLINRKLSSADIQTFKKLKDEQKFVEETAELLDRVRQLMELMLKTVNDTNQDFFDHAHRAAEMKEEIKMHKETISVLYAREDMVWTVVDKLKTITTDWTEADLRIGMIKQFLNSKKN